MPGILGFTHINVVSKEANLRQLNRMSMELYYGKYFLEKQYSDPSITALEINLNEKGENFDNNDEVIVWLDGEIYNQNEISSMEWIKSDSELIKYLYEKDKTFKFLPKLDGYFSAVIYDKKSDLVHLISDRYGLRHLYYTIYNNSLYFSSEVKGFLGIEGFIPEIDLKTLDSFLSLGYPLENRTWFKDVSLLPTGNILTWNLKETKVYCKKYWWWDDIKQNNLDLKEEDIIEEMGYLFKRAIKKRSLNKVGITLSGGLDSRAILAAVDSPSKDFEAITFGLRNCEDVRIAKRAAKIKGVNHTVYELNEKNWIFNKFKSVWIVDGQLDISHMHGTNSLSKFRGNMEYNLNGYAGDLIMGGSFLKGNMLDPSGLEHTIIASNLGHIASNSFRISNHINMDKYSSLKKYDYFYLQNRVRRFTYSGSKILQSAIENRKPFYDNELIEFVYSISDVFRVNSSIYKKMLLKQFPLFFEKLPWQKTGIPISWSKELERKYSNVINNLRNFKHQDYTDYSNWIRMEPARSIFYRILVENKQALYRNYISGDKVEKEWYMHINNKKNYSINLSRYLTIEIWLQQVYNKKREWNLDL